MKTADDFYKGILQAKKHPRPDYGGRVLPAMEIYAGLRTFDERKAYQDAIEKMLRSEADDVREFAVELCLGFFVFRDVMNRVE